MANLAEPSGTTSAAAEREDATSPDADEGGETADSRLELVPPSEREDDEEEAPALGNSGDSGVERGESVVEELARTQEELANARQENEYLAERIAELESELARQEAEASGGVADTTLAEMEDRLREERLAAEPEPELELPEPSLVLPESFDEEDDAPGSGEAEGSKATAEAPDATARRASPRTPIDDGEAVELDADDPETRLDLARAYLAMGNKDAARQLLEGVLEDGDEEQVREARDMLGEL